MLWLTLVTEHDAFVRQNFRYRVQKRVGVAQIEGEQGVAHLLETTTTEGPPPLRSLQGWEPRTSIS